MNEEITPSFATEKTDALANLSPRTIDSRSVTGLALLSCYLKESDQRGLAKTTLTRYAHVCKTFFEYAGSLTPNEIRPRDVRGYLAWHFGRGASNQTLRQELSALKSIFRYAEALEIVAVSPARSVQTHRHHPRLPRVLTEEEVNKLIGSQNCLRDRALLEVMYATGCRVGEIVGMRIEHVSWSDRTILVNGKGNKERFVPLNGVAISRLQQYLGERKTGWLFQAEGQPGQRGILVRSKIGFWLGRWRHDYQFETPTLSKSGRLRWRFKTVRLGRLDELTREEARERLSRLIPTDRRPRPVSC